MKQAATGSRRMCEWREGRGSQAELDGLREPRADFSSLLAQFLMVIMIALMVFHPFPLVVHPPILAAVRAFPAPILVILGPASLMPLIPLVIPLLGIKPIVMSREGITGIDTMLTVVVAARSRIVTSTGEGHTGSSRREQRSEEKYFHVETSRVRIPHLTIKRRATGAVKQAASRADGASVRGP